MNKRIIVIDQCFECPHYCHELLMHFQPGCELAVRDLYLTLSSEIPEWCPLPKPAEESSPKVAEKCRNGVKRYEKTFSVEVETWVTGSNEEGFVRHVSDPEGKAWRACVRHSNGVLEWEWFDDLDQAVAWCERFGKKRGEE